MKYKTAYVCAFLLTLELAKLRTQVHMTCHNSVCEQKEKSDIFELVVEMLEEIKEKITAISVSKQGNIAAVHHNLKAEMRITVLALKVMDDCNKRTHSFYCMASRRKQLHNSINVFDCHFRKYCQSCSLACNRNPTTEGWFQEILG